MAEPVSESNTLSLLSLGHGYVAQALAALLAPAGWRVLGTTRDPSRALWPHAIGFDGEPSADLLRALASADAILCSIPPGAAGDPGLRAAQAARPLKARWIGYLSTTGVFGDLGGRWAFEWSPPRPQSEEAQRRWAAEQGWLALGAHVFRLPGLYGPGRSPFDRLRAGSAQRIVKPGQVFSRAHVDDIAAALAASIARPNPGRVYAICDDEPAPPQDVTAFAAQLMGVAPPPEVAFEAAQLSPMAQRFYAESKRVSNARAKAELGWRPRYPSYREGLRAIYAAEQQTG